MKKLHNIPTHVLMGFLDVGKSSAVRSLLDQKIPHEKWLVIVNEFGKVAVDQLLLIGDQNTQINEVGGGCMCCSANLLLKTKLNNALRSFRPDRVIIEPTGLAHPKNIMEILSEDFKDVLKLSTVATIVDPTQFDTEKFQKHQSYQDQLLIGDVIICNKIDIATDKQISQVVDWSSQHHKTEHQVTNGEIQFSWLGTEHIEVDLATDENHDKDQSPSQLQDEHTSALLTPMVNVEFALGFHSCGFEFPRTYIFRSADLIKIIDNLKYFARVKGVIQCRDGAISINKSGNQNATVEKLISPANCLEFISETPINIDILLETLTLASKQNYDDSSPN